MFVFNWGRIAKSANKLALIFDNSNSLAGEANARSDRVGEAVAASYCRLCYNYLDSEIRKSFSDLRTTQKRYIMGDSPIPSFTRPPVVETFLGVQFVPLKEWSIPYFGLYWNRLRPQFKRVEVRPPVVSGIETDAVVAITLRQSPHVRCWYIGPNPTELVQVQQDRFLVNWRQLADDDKYPRYHERVRPLFIDQWEQFKAFLKQESIVEPEILQCEFTYINHIPRGEGWKVAADWDKVFTICGVLRGEEFLPDPESRRFALNYPMPGGLGSLDVEAARAIRTRDAKDVIQFTISAKGRPQSSATEDICKWFDAGHEWIVKGFAELTKKEMHTRWGREL